MRASIMLTQPHLDALRMEPVCAGKHGDLVVDFDSVHANRTFGAFNASKHILGDCFLWEGVDGILRGWGRRSAVPILLCQL